MAVRSVVMLSVILVALTPRASSATDFCGGVHNPFTLTECLCNSGANCWEVNCCDGTCTFLFENPFPNPAIMPACWDVDTPSPIEPPPTISVIVNGVEIDRFTGYERCFGGSSGRPGLCVVPSGTTVVQFINVTDSGPFDDEVCVGADVAFQSAQTYPDERHFLWAFAQPDQLPPDKAGTHRPSSEIRVVHQIDCGPAPAVLEVEITREAESGGHDHGGESNPDATGALAGNPETVSIPSVGELEVDYFSGIYAGVETILFSCPEETCGTELAAIVPVTVKLNDLIALIETTTVELVGCTPEHRNNHFLAIPVALKLLDAAERYGNEFPSSPRIHVNDCSLEWGGKFDWKAAWSFGPDVKPNEHAQHRRGLTCDIRTTTGGRGLYLHSAEACEAPQNNFDSRFPTGWIVMPENDGRCCNPPQAGGQACPCRYQAAWRRFVRETGGRPRSMVGRPHHTSMHRGENDDEESQVGFHGSFPRGPFPGPRSRVGPVEC